MARSLGRTLLVTGGGPGSGEERSGRSRCGHRHRAQAGRSSAASREAILPPERPWSGKSRDLVRPASDPWATPAEASGLTATPRYDETVAWLRRLVAASSVLDMVSLGKSPEGRDLWLVIASKERAFTPEALRAAGKPTLFAQAAIHAGEVDGKDAGMMLLRDLTVGGHEARASSTAPTSCSSPSSTWTATSVSPPSPASTSADPKEAGYRTTARNLNLNRDYAKLDAPEMRHLVRAAQRVAGGPLLRPPRHRRHRPPVRHDLRPQLAHRLVAVHRGVAREHAPARGRRAPARAGAHARPLRPARGPRGSREGPPAPGSPTPASRTDGETPATSRPSWWRPIP